MNVVKKCERLIFKERENEMQSNLEMINRQNELMVDIKARKIACKSKRRARSSIKVLEELDINRKQAYQTLE